MKATYFYLMTAFCMTTIFESEAKDIVIEKTITQQNSIQIMQPDQDANTQILLQSFFLDDKEQRRDVILKFNGPYSDKTQQWKDSHTLQSCKILLFQYGKELFEKNTKQLLFHSAQEGLTLTGGWKALNRYDNPNIIQKNIEPVETKIDKTTPCIGCWLDVDLTRLCKTETFKNALYLSFKTRCTKDSCPNGQGEISLKQYSTQTPQPPKMQWTFIEKCGDGIMSGDEACDDGNTLAGDGCSADCKNEAGWTCTAEKGKKSTCTDDSLNYLCFGVNKDIKEDSKQSDLRQQKCQP